MGSCLNTYSFLEILSRNLMQFNNKRIYCQFLFFVPFPVANPHPTLDYGAFIFRLFAVKMGSLYGMEGTLAKLHSAIKRIRSNERKRVRNRIIRSRARSAVVNARASMTDSSNETSIRGAVRELDRAAAKGVIHKNNAARRKSRLLRRLHSLKKPKSTG
jgi:small subunit ribosomal protein S20